MKGLSDEQSGKLIKAIGEFSDGVENPIITDPLVMGIFLAIKRDFQLQAENYLKIVERNRLNGKSGGRPKTQLTQQNPLGSLVTQHNPQNLKDKDKDKDIDKDIDKVYKAKDIDKTELASNTASEYFSNKSSNKEFDRVFGDMFTDESLPSMEYDEVDDTAEDLFS